MTSKTVTIMRKKGKMRVMKKKEKKNLKMKMNSFHLITDFQVVSTLKLKATTVNLIRR